VRCECNFLDINLATPLSSVAKVLERRVALLEDENNTLRNEACRIVETVEQSEAEEKYLVDDAIKRLGIIIISR